MRPLTRSVLFCLTLLCPAMAGLPCQMTNAADDPAAALTLVVMDPLAAPLACDCVKGYAQRKYEVLGKFLESQLGRPVHVVWGESLEKATEGHPESADLIIGKHSVVLADAKEVGVPLKPVAQLTDLKDQVTQTGLFVVRSADPAKSVQDLAGYRILFGPADCDEKSAAPLALLKQHGVPVPGVPETSPSCSNAAQALMELPAETRAAAVISSYAGPLLEGCGKINKGDLRVVGESRPVPFITAFLRTSMPENEQAAVASALEEVEFNAQLLIDLESASGFRTWDDRTATTAAAGQKKSP